MAANAPLIQPSDVATYAPKLSLSNSADSAQIALLVGEVSDMARRFCDREWWIGSYTEQHIGKNSTILMVRHRPITAITNLTIANACGNWLISPAATDPNGNPFPQYQGYWTDGQSIYVGGGLRFSTTSPPMPNVYVTYSAGYASLTGGPGGTPDYASIPADLKLALIKETVFRYEESKRVGLRTVSDGNQQNSSYLTGALDPEAMGILKKWRKTWGAGL